MTSEELRPNTRPSHGEAPFGLDEAFYSRTDDRGVIVAGNLVFQRVSDYSWDDLLGAPHKVIRHPDMPKGVFWLFWDTLKQGKPIGAYVKNRARDGLYYWVFAVAVPCKGGYLSARIKPSSDLFETVRADYAALLEHEKASGCTPEESAAHLLEVLKKTGFDSYQQFATHALGEELLSRDDKMARPRNRMLMGYRQALDHARSVDDATDELVKDFSAIRYAPINMGVIASRIEPTGGPINSLSKNYGQMSREMSDWFDRAVVGPDSTFAAIKTSIMDSLYVVGMSQILTQCADQLESERRRLGDTRMEEERAFLTGLVKHYTRLSDDNLLRVAEEAKRISAACKKMDQMVLGLSTTRVLCCVESARLTEGSESLNNIIGQLKVHQDRIAQRLETIAMQSSAIDEFVAKFSKKAGPRRATA